ncbi:OmpH/Skp family outer membrane protein [Fulvitalea axinellae]
MKPNILFRFVVTLVLPMALALLPKEAKAQKFGYVDSEYILGQMPEFKEAQKSLDQLAEAWRQEISDMRKGVEGMYDALKAEEVLLSKEMLAERQKNILAKEDSVANYQRKVFGFEGLYYLKKIELIKPVEDKVFEAVRRVSEKQKIQFMFDKSADLVMIYTNPAHDYTDYVLEELGLGDENDTVN